MVDVAHDGHDRGAQLQVSFFIFGAVCAEFDIGLENALEGMAEFVDDQFRGVCVDGLVAGRHDAHFHELLDDVAETLRHAVGEFLNGDDFRDNDFAELLDLLLLSGSLLAHAFAGAALCRHTGCAGVAVAADSFIDDLMDGQLAAVAALIVTTRAARAFLAEGVGGFFCICVNDSASIKVNLAACRLLVGGRRDDGSGVRRGLVACCAVRFRACGFQLPVMQRQESDAGASASLLQLPDF